MNRKTLAALATFLVALGTLLGALVGPTDTTTRTVPAVPPAIAVDGPDKDTKPDDAIPLDPAAQAQVKRIDAATAGDPAVGDLRGADSTKAGVIEGPLAAQEIPGCRTAFVRNFSQRTARVQLIVWHQTVSHENGLSSQNALTARANDPTTQVSWTALVGRSNGLCTYTVPLPYKAWAQGNANSASAGIEVEALGDEPSYVTGKGKAKLFSVTRYIAKAEGIPIQHAVVSWGPNCQLRVIKAGILEHHELGSCGGGHVDVCSTALCHSGGPDTQERSTWRIGPLIAELAAQSRPKPCSKRTACRMGRRHAAVHKAIAAKCHGKPARTHVKACRQLRARNAYMHRYARAHHLVLVTK